MQYSKRRIKARITISPPRLKRKFGYFVSFINMKTGKMAQALGVPKESIEHAVAHARAHATERGIEVVHEDF